MKTEVFLNFLSTLIIKQKNKYLGIFFISVVLVFLVSSVMFISNSLKKEVFTTLENQADFIVQKLEGTKIVNIPTSWIDDFSQIAGVDLVKQRVYGQYHFKIDDIYFTIVGIDFFEENKNLENLLKALDISTFLEKDSMIIGQGVKKIFDKYHYFNSYDFTLDNFDIKNVKIFKALPKESNLVANDLIIMDINLAKQILNIKEDEATDLTLEVPNDLERANIKNQLILKQANIKITQKEQLRKEYENLFNYKGGFFLVLFIIVLATFTLILYQRYSMISSNDKKEIAILKAVGWSIKDIIKLKLSENFIISFVAFLVGVILAYIFVFLLNAPILRDIFLGFSNIPNEAVFNLYIDLSDLIMLFLFFIVPILSAVLIPVWKLAIIDVNESIK